MYLLVGAFFHKIRLAKARQIHFFTLFQIFCFVLFGLTQKPETQD